LTKEIGMLCVGVGFVGGSAHVPSFRKAEGSKLVGIAVKLDVPKGPESEQYAKTPQEKYGIEIFYDYDEALKDSRINGVCIAVPTPFHYIYAEAAIKAGKNVYLEMPVAPTVEKVKKLKEMAAKAGVTVMPILNFRFTPNYVKAKELFDKGAIGEPIALTFREFIAAKDLAGQWPLTSWAWDYDKAGGYPDFTLSVWSLDMLRWFFNTDIEETKWYPNYKEIVGVDNFRGYQTVGIIKLKNGVVGTVQMGSSQAEGLGESRFEIFGNNGKTLYCEWNNVVKLIGANGETEEFKLESKGPEVWGHKQLAQHFINVCLGKEKPIATLDDAIAAITQAKNILIK
jgi:predicted dehydrogenase